MSDYFKNKNILLVSQNLQIEGAAIVLYNLAQILINLGFNIDILAFQNGPLSKKYSELGININFGLNYKEYPFFLHQKLINYDLIIANTSVSYKIVEKLKDYVPVIWYLHESKIPELFIKNMENFNNIYCVSEYAKEELEKSFSNLNQRKNIKIIYNYVEDENKSKEKSPPRKDFTTNHEHQKVIFNIVGTISERKNQLGLLKAYSILPEKYKNKCQINIIGSNGDSKYYNSLMQLKDDNINFTGVVTGNKRIELFNAADVFVVPSLDDPASLVVFEACMLSKPLIVSDKVGAKYMLNDKNGIIFKYDDIQALKDSLIYMIDNKDSLTEMGKYSRKMYEQLATKEKYINDWINILKNEFNKQHNLKDKSDFKIKHSFLLPITVTINIIYNFLSYKISKQEKKKYSLEKNINILKNIYNL